MKNRLESELISIAHRVLKLKNKSEIAQLQQETLRLYEKLSVLLFVEENYHDPMIKIPSDVEKKLENISDPTEKNVIQTKEISEITPSENDSETDNLFSEKENSDHIEDSLTQRSDTKSDDAEKTPIEKDTYNKNVVSNETLSDTQDKKMNFEDFEAQLSNAKPKKTAVFFEEKVVAPEKSIPTTETDFSETKKSDEMNQPTQKNFDIRLNDRVAFEFHLFNGETESFERIISQLSIFNTFEQAKDFIENIVKPNYNNWFMKEEYENRFMRIIENRFM